MKLDQEQWKPIKDYENLYEVSNLGRVKSLHKGTERILNAGKCSGYFFVNLYKDGKKKTHLVHRLVAQSFLDNPHSLPCINHKDENPLNNRVENLEWCDVKYNNNYGTRIKRISKAVLQFTLDGQLVKEWKSTQEAERNGFDSGNICRCCNNKNKFKTHRGYKWVYKKEQP